MTPVPGVGSGRKVLVIGGCGFIGSHLVDALLRRGVNVRVFDRQVERFRPPLPGVDYRMGNFSDRMALVEAVSGVDVVVHLVSTTFPGTADLDPRTDIQDNLVATIGLLDSMVLLGIPRIVYLSSGGTVYGPPDCVPIPETHPLRPINSYGIVKVAIENYLGMYRRTRGLRPLILRPSNPYGPRQGHTGLQGVISTFLRRALHDEPIEVWGDGSVVRDFVDVRDLAELCARAVTSDVEGTFNAGSGQGVCVNEIIELVREITGRDLKTIYKPGRAIDVPRSVLDATSAHRTFDWSANTPLRQGLAENWQWLKDIE